MDFSDLEFSPFEYPIIDEITSPLLCLLRFRQLVCPIGYVDKEKMKKLVCDFIDNDCTIENFSNDNFSI